MEESLMKVLKACLLSFSLALLLVPGTAYSQQCPANKKSPHWKVHNGECLPSCGAAKGEYCKNNPNKCRSNAGFTPTVKHCSKTQPSYPDGRTTVSLESYQHNGNCCLVLPPPSPEIRTVTTSVRGACPSHLRRPHWKSVEGRCVPSCGAAKGEYCKKNPLKCQYNPNVSDGPELKHCSKVQSSYSDGRTTIKLEAYDQVGQCCLILQTGQAYGMSATRGACGSNPAWIQVEPHWKTITYTPPNGEETTLCFPSCGEAQNGFCRNRVQGGECNPNVVRRRGKDCANSKNPGFQVILLDTYENRPCCIARPKDERW